MTAQVASLLLLVLSAPGGTKLSKFEQGQRAFNSGDLEVALKHLDAAVLEGGDQAVVEKVQLLRAQCFAARQDFSRAEEAFAAALEVNPEAALDPARVDPTVVKLLESVRGRLTGTIEVTSTPPGAALTLDGKGVGVAPQTLTAPIGHRRLEARWGQGPLTAADVLVRPRKDTRVEWVQSGAGAGGDCQEAPAPRPLRPFGDVRFTLEIPAGWPGVSATYGLDLGGGFEVSYFRVGLWARLFPYAGVVPRAMFSLPVYQSINAFLELEVPLWFMEPSSQSRSGLALGLGGAAGAEFFVQRWFGFFLQIGGQHLFLTPRNDSTHFVATTGARLRLP